MKRAIAILLAATQLAGCYTWRPQVITPDTSRSDSTMLAHVRVHDQSGRMLALDWVTIRGDSLHGRIQGRDDVRDTTIALGDITEMQARHTTAAPVAVSLIVVGALAMYLVAQNLQIPDLGK